MARKTSSGPTWERVIEMTDATGAPGDLTERLRVPGGWIYRTQTAGAGEDSWVMSTVFVPEPHAKRPKPIRVKASELPEHTDEVTYRGRRWHWMGDDLDGNHCYQTTDGDKLIAEAEAELRTAPAAEAR